MLVTVYVESGIRGPARRSGAGTWLVEYIRKDGTPETRPVDPADAVTWLPDTTQAALELNMLIDALSILTKPCSVRINTECEHILNVFENGWIEKWKESDWQNSKGKPVANAELWQQVSEYIDVHEDVLVEKGENSYRNIMQMEILKEEKRRKENGTNIH
nr:MAG TPA: ribonuclease HI [Caudoviricetes sp.]